MNDRTKALLEATGISLAPVGVYDLPDPASFEPFTRPSQCVFSDFKEWQNGKSTMIRKDNAAEFECPGAGHWLCGISTMPPEVVAQYLAGQEGLKASEDIMRRWLEHHPPYKLEYNAVVISRLREDHDAYLKAVTFFVTPDQLSLLITGAEYFQWDSDQGHVSVPYGSGCGQLLALFRDFQRPCAMIGATDIGMRKYLPADILTFTMTKSMFEQLCALDEDSFLHKTFWRDLRETRQV